jgi:S1-C subfamily serine protease
MSDPHINAERKKLGSLLRSVVRVIAISDAPDYEQPWQTQGPSTSSGSGAIIDTPAGLRVLTNAHCVEQTVFVELRRYGKGRKFVGHVDAIAHECDLALLSVEDPTFFEGVTPLRFGTLPYLGDKVKVCGYPIGGDRVSITQGIVSRIDLVSYAQSDRDLLAVQIDAAINSGNSGGPVLKNGKLVGVAFQTLDEATGVGYVIPVPIIQHFVNGADGGYLGFPSFGFAVQNLESSAHRRSLGLDREGTGVLVTRVAFQGSADGVLEPGDVVLEIDGVPIEDAGTVALRDGEIIDFGYLLVRHQVGDRVPVAFWRGGAVHRATLTLRPPVQLVPEDGPDTRPSYFVYGGLVLIPLTRNYLKTWGENFFEKAPHQLLALLDHGVPSEECQVPVVLQKVLADEVNVGYHDLESVIVRSVQGVRVRNLRHLVMLVDAADGDFVRFETVDGRQIVLDRRVVAERAPRLLARFGVPSDRSDCLRTMPALVAAAG